jgi:hypothetical protein
LHQVVDGGDDDDQKKRPAAPNVASIDEESARPEEQEEEDLTLAADTAVSNKLNELTDDEFATTKQDDGHTDGEFDFNKGKISKLLFMDHNFNALITRAHAGLELTADELKVIAEPEFDVVRQPSHGYHLTTDDIAFLLTAFSGSLARSLSDTHCHASLIVSHPRSQEGKTTTVQLPLQSSMGSSW